MIFQKSESIYANKERRYSYSAYILKDSEKFDDRKYKKLTKIITLNIFSSNNFFAFYLFSRLSLNT